MVFISQCKICKFQQKLTQISLVGGWCGPWRLMQHSNQVKTRQRLDQNPWPLKIITVLTLDVVWVIAQQFENVESFAEIKGGDS